MLWSSNARRPATNLPRSLGPASDASEDEKALCQERTAELSTLVNEFILRRTNTLLSEHLPPKVGGLCMSTLVWCCCCSAAAAAGRRCCWQVIP